MPIEARSIRVRRYADGYCYAIIQTPAKQISMAKVYECAVDPDEFIRSFRDDPSGVSRLKKEHSEKKSDDTASENKEKSEPPIPATTVAQPVPTDAENEYRQKFITNVAYLRPKSRFLMVEISPDFIQKIKRIISYEENTTCSIKSFVNNVLADHFKRYEDVIKKWLWY